MGLMPVDEAMGRLLALAAPLADRGGGAGAGRRALAGGVRPSPRGATSRPFDASAMDGYAIAGEAGAGRRSLP
jgi:molybdopterin biosynthesis enzyme